MTVELLIGAAVGLGVAVLIAAIAVLRGANNSSQFDTPSTSVFFGESPQPFDAENVDFMELLTWTVSRPLTVEGHFETLEVPNRTPQAWVDERALAGQREEVAAQNTSYRPACSMKAYTRSDPSGSEPGSLTLNIVRDSYADYVAISKLLTVDEHYNSARNFIAENSLEEVIARSPLSSIGINVTIVCGDQVLLMRRSNGVATFPGYWQAGPHTSMGYVNGQPETVPQLAKRALLQEVGLTENDYGNRIAFSWFGIYLREATPYLFAHVRCSLGIREVEERVLRASAANETADGGREIFWLRLSAQNIDRITGAALSSPRGKVEVDGRVFLPHAVMSLRNLQRISEVL